MQKCAICEKPIYGHPDAKGKPLVCGSCPLQKLPGGKSGKGEFAVRLMVSKLAKEQSRHAQEATLMKELIVKSNFARNRVVLLDGKHPLFFDSTGSARMPAHLMELLEREMAAKPGRFWIDVPVAEVAVPAPVEVAPPEKVETVEPVREELIPGADLNFLVEDREEAKKKLAPVKAAKKK